jgi:hypothetical protein
MSDQPEHALNFLETSFRAPVPNIKSVRHYSDKIRRQTNKHCVFHMQGLNATCAGNTHRLVAEVGKLSYDFTGVLTDAETNSII